MKEEVDGRRKLRIRLSNDSLIRRVGSQPSLERGRGVVVHRLVGVSHGQTEQSLQIGRIQVQTLFKRSYRQTLPLVFRLRLSQIAPRLSIFILQ